MTAHKNSRNTTPEMTGMKDLFSIVIVCKNEEENIERVLQSIIGVTDDVLVYDNGSTDNTLDILRRYPVTVYRGEWLGYGRTKQQAVAMAKHAWILSIDADEALDETLQNSLRQLSLNNSNEVYKIEFKNYLGDKHLRWGEWGGDKHIRLFNRNTVNWNDAAVHEALIIPASAIVKELPGAVLHRTMRDTAEYSQKMIKYALLSAEKYKEQGKRSSWFKRHINPQFSFIKHYIFKLGFLDGWEGLLSARMTAFYTFLKYARLHELWKNQ